ncbi:MAG: hypothetical protein F4X51_13300 [Gemmatimonadetes bacterium]|nr:hypothetical protein [Gemmatimonadota bacterium]
MKSSLTDLKEVCKGKEANKWPNVSLRDLCMLVNGKAFKPSDWSTSGKPIIRIQNLNDVTRPFNYWDGSLEKQVIVNPGTVLLAWSGTPGTSFGAHIWDREDGVLNQHIFRVDFTRPDISPQWFTYSVNQRLDVLIHQAHGGVGLRHVRKSQVEALEIPLPPLSEQKRIVAILNDHMADIVRARVAAEAQLEAAEALSAAYLRETFKSKESKEWRWPQLKEIAGINPRRPRGLKRPEEAPTTFVPMPSVDGTSGNISDPLERPFGEIKKGYTYFEKNDVLFAKITPCMQNGKHVIARNLIDGIGFGTTEFHVIRPGDEVIPEWIHLYIRQPAILNEAATHFTGSVGQQRVPSYFLEDLAMPLPSLSEQKRIADTLKERLANISRACVAIKENLETINQLPSAILRKAFNGEL